MNMDEEVQTIGVDYSISHSELNMSREFGRTVAIRKIFEQVSVQLHELIKEEEHTYLTMFRFRAYVVSANQLERLIQKEVERRGRMPKVTFYGDTK